ncbi:hypothetical protein [Thiolapillus sp.]
MIQAGTRFGSRQKQSKPHAKWGLYFAARSSLLSAGAKEVFCRFVCFAGKRDFPEKYAGRQNAAEAESAQFVDIK